MAIADPEALRDPDPYRFELFATALMIFWLAAINSARRLRVAHHNGH
jgi:hypothetical protein